jgi:glycosyltransferase involved in cell wall biosynthesis
MSRDDSCSPAYLVGHYPGVSLTFIFREIQILRRLGIRIRTASINAAQPSQDGFTAPEQEEQRQTFYVKARGFARIAGDHFRCLAARPLPYLRGLWFAARLGGLDLRTFVYHLLYFAEAVPLGEWMRREGLRHVHIHCASNTVTVALIASRIFPITYSISVHGPNEFYDVQYYRLRAKIEGASFLCCIGQYCRSQLMRICSPDQWQKFHIVPLGVDPDVFAPRPFPDSDPPNLLCVGRLVPEKGQAILLAAAAHLLQRGNRVHLHIVGDGPSRASLEETSRSLGIRDAVTFHGSVNQQALRPLLSRADIFVLPSFAEGIPVALMEAMSMEIPCVSTFIAGIPELIDSGINGILVPPSDPELLAEAIAGLLSDTQWRHEIGRAGRRKILKAYHLPRNVARLAEIFERELGGRAQARGPSHAPETFHTGV